MSLFTLSQAPFYEPIFTAVTSSCGLQAMTASVTPRGLNYFCSLSVAGEKVISVSYFIIDWSIAVT